MFPFLVLVLFLLSLTSMVYSLVAFSALMCASARYQFCYSCSFSRFCLHLILNSVFSFSALLLGVWENSSFCFNPFPSDQSLNLTCVFLGLLWFLRVWVVSASTEFSLLLFLLWVLECLVLDHMCLLWIFFS